jgi:hypothetical protein
MSELEQRRDAGLDTRAGMDPEAAARATKVRRSAWLLAGLAALFYVGYMAWMVVRASVA